MAGMAYPLQQVLEVKERRVEDAERVVRDKQEALEKEKEKLKQVEAERDKVKKLRKDKLQQLRDVLDEGTNSTEVLQMKAYLNVVDDRLKVEEKKVKDQQGQVDVAEKNLELAREQLRQKRQEVDKLLTHRQDWTKEMRKEQEVIEAREQDEMGNIIFSIKQRQHSRE